MRFFLEKIPVQWNINFFGKKHCLHFSLVLKMEVIFTRMYTWKKQGTGNLRICDNISSISRSIFLRIAPELLRTALLCWHWENLSEKQCKLSSGPGFRVFFCWKTLIFAFFHSFYPADKTMKTVCIALASLLMFSIVRKGSLIKRDNIEHKS